ncbi:hypothetical protein NLS1_26680 [Nocardioides sp. LS1]|nr:hypothetical protein NLS1_26680 [Nocardioides sp. LS1]
MPYPSGLRFDWQKQHTREVLQLIELLDPDVLHIEYLQPAEVALHAQSLPVTATFHDVSQRIALGAARKASGWRAIISWRDYLATRLLEWRLVRRAQHIFVFSERDQQFLASRRGNASVVRIGVDTLASPWIPDDFATCLFAGALWRAPNQLSVEFLVREVMPHVWRRNPAVRLRIVGARPPESLRVLAGDPRVELISDVPDLDIEFARASLNLAPSMVPAGVLLKALRAMSAGAPVVLNENAAAPIAGLVDGLNAVVASTGEQFAEAIVMLLDDPDRLALLGANGRELVARNYSWVACVADYVTRFDELARVRS